MIVHKSLSATYCFEVVVPDETPAAAELQRFVDACERDCTKSPDWMVVIIVMKKTFCFRIKATKKPRGVTIPQKRFETAQQIGTTSPCSMHYSMLIIQAFTSHFNILVV